MPLLLPSLSVYPKAILLHCLVFKFLKFQHHQHQLGASPAAAIEIDYREKLKRSHWTSLITTHLKSQTNPKYAKTKGTHHLL